MNDEIVVRSKSLDYEIPEISVGEYLYNKLVNIQNNTCLIEAKTGKQLTVKQLLAEANSLAVALIKRGITKSDVFLCFSSNNLEYALIQFAIYFLGNTFTPVKPTNGVFEVRNQINDSGSTVILTSVKNANIIHKILSDQNNTLNKRIKFVVVFEGIHNNFISFNQLLKEGNNEKLDRIPYFDIKPKEDIFTIIYTSGSTGLPKGAMHSHISFLACFEGNSTFNPKVKDNLIIATIYPFGHVTGTALIPLWIKEGHTLVLYDGIDESNITQSIKKYKINLLPLFTAFGHQLLNGDLGEKYDISSVKYMMTAGTKFPLDLTKGLIKKYNIALREGYGMTEFVLPFDNPFNSEYIPGSVGNISANHELKIVDLKTGQSLGPNKDGEICVRGPLMFVGYLNNESATKSAIDSNGWYHSGDIGHYDENERLFITDRLKEMIKFKAWSVAPAEIEALLMTHKSVDSVAVIGVKHTTDGQYPRAYIKVKSGKKVTEEELVAYVEENMAFQSRLRGGVRFVDEIPRSIIGKVDRQFFKNLVNDEVIGL